MVSNEDIYELIAKNGFDDATLRLIDQFITDIQNGAKDFYRFNQQEHAGLCKGGAALIGATIIADYARASITTSGDAEGCPKKPTNWQIDERQEQIIEQWAKASKLWVPDSERIIITTFGPKIAQGAESKVYYRDADTSVVKERTSIYSTTQKALDAITLHNYLFPETAMRVIGFTRDSDGLLRTILTQPYIRCLRLATKDEIDKLVMTKGFHDNWLGKGVNYASERLLLEDMHPANVFIDDVDGEPICIDCIVKFNNSTK